MITASAGDGLRVGIDASNIRAGGGVTHLAELLAAADPPSSRIAHVSVWGARATLERLPERTWLTRVAVPALEGVLPRRLLWQHRALDSAARVERVDVLFVPGGSYAGRLRPFVTMSQNLLLFDAEAARAYRGSLMGARLALLARAQRATFRRADGVIFLTRTAQQVVEQAIGVLRGATAVIPHGVAPRFRRAPVGRPTLTAAQPFRWLYVSIVDHYKHQWHVAEAVAALHAAGRPVTLDLVGPAYPPALARLRQAMARHDPGGEVVRYHGAVPHEHVDEFYHRADGFVFASSCENLPNILLEAMSAGLPIACSNSGVMPEVLGDAGLYFNPDAPATIARALERLIAEPELRIQLATRARGRAAAYTWERCAAATFEFLASVGTRVAGAAPAAPALHAP